MGGGDPALAVALLGRALLTEDAEFHWFQTYEAAVRQFHAWPPGSEEGALILAGTARFLAAHTPTRRELSQVVTHRHPPPPRRGPLRGVLAGRIRQLFTLAAVFRPPARRVRRSGQVWPGAGFFGTECSQSARIARSAATRATGWSSGTWW